MTYRKSELFVLLILVVFSKEILVFNEEILVLLSFIVFSLLLHNFAISVFLLELNMRSCRIKEEFFYYKCLHKKTFIHFVSYFNKQRLLSEKVKIIFSVVGNNIESALSNNLLLFSNLLVLSVNDKLNRLVFFESSLIISLRREINLKLFAFLVVVYNKNRLRFKKSFLRFALNCLFI